MKVSVGQKNFRKALLLTEKVVGKNTSLPILNNILLKTENGRLRLSATNLEIGINTFIGSKIDEVGEIAVPAKILNDFISTINDEKITLVTKNNSLYINTDHYKTQILGFDPKDFPIIPKIKSEPICSVPPGELKNTLIAVLDSVSLSDSRPELAGVYVYIKNNQAVFASTDSFRLTEKILRFKHQEPATFILPRNTVSELIRVCGDLEDNLQIKFSENQISFFNDDFEILSRVVDGNYPDYKKVIPEGCISRVLVDKQELEKHLRLSGLFSSQVSDVKIQCSDNNLVLTAKNSDKGEIETSVPVTLKNEPFEISLNYRYLLDGLKNISTPSVILEYTGQGSPLLVKPGDDNKDMVYLIMPLRS
ncbi:DNA polymerase III subunit beta [Candidatus Parcubacteria bacterium]|nr:DNA polymerase III subunit beta [Candidatus Parcubacteria bacterium]